MTVELIEKAKACKSAEELLTLAKETNYPLTAEEAAEQFAALHNEGELADDELDAAAGGACETKVGGDKKTVVSSGLNCFTGEFESIYDENGRYRKDVNFAGRSDGWEIFSVLGKAQCGHCIHLGFKGGLGYCKKS